MAKMEQVLDIYKQPYNRLNPVVCMDESPKQLIEDKAHIEMKPGHERKIDYEYIRHGVVNIFMACEPLRGRRLIKITDRKTKTDWAEFIQDISNKYTQAERITLVMDNLGTHTLGALYEAFTPEEARKLRNRFEFIYTPKHGSWLNMAEIELQVLNRQCLNRHITSKATIISETNAWQEARNGKESKINWQFTTENARIKLKKLYPPLYD